MSATRLKKLSCKKRIASVRKKTFSKKEIPLRTRIRRWNLRRLVVDWWAGLQVVERSGSRVRSRGRKNGFSSIWISSRKRWRNNRMSRSWMMIMKKESIFMSKSSFFRPVFHIFFRNLPRSSPTPQGLSSSQPHLNLLGGRDGDLRSKSAAQGTFKIKSDLSVLEIWNVTSKANFFIF